MFTCYLRAHVCARIWCVCVVLSERRTPAQTALKKLDLLALHYHKVDLECTVVQGHLSEMKTVEEGIAKRCVRLFNCAGARF